MVLKLDVTSIPRSRPRPSFEFQRSSLAACTELRASSKSLLGTPSLGISGRARTGCSRANLESVRCFTSSAMLLQMLLP